MSWPVTRTRVAYENPWIVVHEDDVVRPDGTPGTYGVIEVRRPAVFVVALTDADEVVLVTIDRHTVGTSIEVPAGGTDGEDPLVAARRELAEETGLAATTWRCVGEMSALNGIARAPEVVYLATGLHEVGDAGHFGEQLVEGISAVSRVPVREALAMIRRGEITDGESVGALMFALLELGRVA
jgi:8-oxo-dGTP pyrophosphatase MutT (NUDIX family)